MEATPAVVPLQFSALPFFAMGRRTIISSANFF
jgi:hypothetical protein